MTRLKASTRRSNNIISSIVRVALALLIVCSLGFQNAQAQEDCNQQLSEASKQFSRGFFNRTIDLLASCKRTAFTSQESTIEAYRLIALSNIALDQEENAHEWVKKIVTLDRRYTPDPDDLLRFRELVEEFRPGSKTLLVGGLGAAAAFTTVLLLSRGETGSESPLPGPISLPR